jgi:hypothetical protein
MPPYLANTNRQESGGCCPSASLHDDGRIGLFMLNGGVAGGEKMLPDGATLTGLSEGAAQRREIGSNVAERLHIRNDGRIAYRKRLGVC